MLRSMNERLQAIPAAPRWRPGAATLTALLAGVMLTTAMPPYEGTAPLALLALALLFHALRAAAHPARTAFVFGVGHMAPLLVWLFYLDPAKSIPTRALVPVQAVAAILFVAIHYLFLGVAVGLARRWRGPRGVLPLLPILWLGVELLRSVGELGFPWCLVGAAWLDTPLMPLYAAAGEIGMGAATALSAAALVAAFDLIRLRPPDRAHRWGLVAASCLLWVGLWLGSRPAAAAATSGGQRTAPLRVASVQADVLQADKWDDARIDSTIVPYTALTRAAAAAGAELAVWAETAVPAYLLYDRDLVNWVQGLARQSEIAILTGFPDARLIPGELDAQGNRRYERYNAAGLFSAAGELLGRYSKHHLVPLGEAIPFQRWLPALGRLDVGQAEWTPGAPPGPLALPTTRGEVPLITLICFEAVFSDLARQAVRRGGSVLVNITNDGWFGHPAGPAQHAALSRIRAAECGVPLVRSANNGISLITDDRGVVLAQLGLHRRGVIHAEIMPRPRGTWFVRAGFWPVVGFLGLWTLLAVLLLQRRGASEAAGAGEADEA